MRTRYTEMPQYTYSDLLNYLQVVLNHAVRLVTSGEGFTILLVFSAGYWYSTWLRRGHGRN